MNYKLFSMYDEASGQFMAPSMEISEAMAIRNFRYAVDNNGLIRANKSDFRLYLVGYFDSDTGILVKSDVPTVVDRGDNVKDEVKNE